MEKPPEKIHQTPEQENEALRRLLVASELRIAEQELEIVRLQEELRRREEAVHAEIDELEADITPLANHMEALSEQAITDPLTGAFNRRTFDTDIGKLAGMLRHNERREQATPPTSIIAFDLDHFKSINTNYEHAGGDAALRAVVHAVQSKLRPSDKLYRVGGEEFALLCMQATLDEAKQIAERLRRTIAETPILVTGKNGEETIYVTASIGVAEVNPHSENPGLNAYNSADALTNEAKSAGRNRVISSSGQ